ncbi:hypothetical protein UFOVP331_185 [uncultured Caudovirales phage]|uniref:Uncharacterized protein n=1 Tax=uncultured Caudovirales phage TaxID=2100421 RepID=A0A6J5LVX5_9CAUD|nr:hypothetical protein UFOVP331_185 [uncultured Caudovirales phage]
MNENKIREMVQFVLSKPVPERINSKEYISNRKSENPIDTITMDVPLFIRMMEFSREDAQSDMDLHDVAEKAISLSNNGKTLTMSDYETMFGGELNEAQSSSNEVTIFPEVEIKSLKFLADIVNRVIESLAKAGKNIDENSFKQLNADLNILLTSINNKIDKINKMSSTGGLSESMSDEAYVPYNIKKFAEQRGVSSLVDEVADWVKEVRARITGGTAIGKNYSTLVLDMGNQTSDIHIDTDNETIKLYGKPVRNFNEFKEVYMDKMTQDQIEHDEYTLRKERGLEEGLPKGYWSKKIPGGKMEESYKTLVNKLEKKGKSEKASKAIAGAIASYKKKGGGKGPTAKQKSMAETIMSKLKGK